MKKSELEVGKHYAVSRYGSKALLFREGLVRAEVVSIKGEVRTRYGKAANTGVEVRFLDDHGRAKDEPTHVLRSAMSFYGLWDAYAQQLAALRSDRDAWEQRDAELRAQFDQAVEALEAAGLAPVSVHRGRPKSAYVGHGAVEMSVPFFGHLVSLALRDFEP